MSTYHKTTSSSVDGCSMFEQKGQSMIVSHLEQDKDLSTKGARLDQCPLPDVEKPTTKPPASQEVLFICTGYTSRFPPIESYHGNRAKLQKREEGQKDNSYEAFLQDLRLSNKLECMFNRYSNSRPTNSAKGGLLQENFVTTVERMKHRKPSKPNTPWSPWVTEHADKFGFLQRAYPPHVTPDPAQSSPTVSGTQPRHRGLCTEYQANYTTKTRPLALSANKATTTDHSSASALNLF